MGCCAFFLDRHLADCDQKSVQVSFCCPGEDIHYLVLGIPSVYSREPFAGSLRVEEASDNNNVLEFEFTSDIVQPSNWLDDQKLIGYILTWHKEQWPDFTPGHQYLLTLDFTTMQPNDSSLWLFWIEHNVQAC